MKDIITFDLFGGFTLWMLVMVVFAAGIIALILGALIISYKKENRLTFEKVTYAKDEPEKIPPKAAEPAVKVVEPVLEVEAAPPEKQQEPKLEAKELKEEPKTAKKSPVKKAAPKSSEAKRVEPTKKK